MGEVDVGHEAHPVRTDGQALGLAQVAVAITRLPEAQHQLEAFVEQLNARVHHVRDVDVADGGDRQAHRIKEPPHLVTDSAE